MGRVGHLCLNHVVWPLQHLLKMASNLCWWTDVTNLFLVKSWLPFKYSYFFLKKIWPSRAGIQTLDFQWFSHPWFEFSWKVRVMRSNLGKEVKISRLYWTLLSQMLWSKRCLNSLNEMGRCSLSKRCSQRLASSNALTIEKLSKNGWLWRQGNVSYDAFYLSSQLSKLYCYCLFFVFVFLK